MALQQQVYDAAPWGWHVAFGLSLLASCCLSIFLFRGNLRQALRQPLALAAALWGIGHLFANGELASVLLFGAITTCGLVVFWRAWAGGVRPSPDVRGGHDLLSLVMGLAIFGIAVQLHGALTGVPVLVLAR